MDYSLPQRLQDYVESELHHEALYRALADVAPNEADRQIFLEIAENEHRHADSFSRMYRKLTGLNYTPKIYPQKMEGPYQFALRQLMHNANKTFPV